MYKIVLYLILSFTPILAYSKNVTSQVTTDTKVVDDYTHHLVKEGLDILQDTGLTQDVKIKRVRALILENLDIDRMVNDTLANYKRQLDKKQIDQFKTVYAQYVSKVYSDLVKNYKGQKVNIVNISPLGIGEFSVKVAIIDNNQPQPINVEYRVCSKELGGQPQLKVFDVITSGVGIISAQRNVFTSTIERNGGIQKGFDVLVNQLKDKS